MQLLAQAAGGVHDTTVNLIPTGQFAGLNGITIPGIITFAVSAVLVVAGLIFFFMLIIGGIKWILSGGDKAQTEAARNQITAALIGLVIVFAAWAIITLLSSIFGISILSLTLPGIK